MPRGPRSQLHVELPDPVRQELEALQRSTTLPAGLARRGRLILLLAAGTPISEIARLVGMERRHVYKWARRFQTDQLAGLIDLPRGRPRGSGLSLSSSGIRQDLPGEARRTAAASSG